MYGVKVAEPAGAPVAEIVPEAAGVVVALLGIGNGAAEELGTITAEVLVVTSTGVEVLTTEAGAVGFGAAEVVLPKLAGRVIPLAAAQSLGESPYGVGLVEIRKGHLVTYVRTAISFDEAE